MEMLFLLLIVIVLVMICSRQGKRNEEESVGSEHKKEYGIDIIESITLKIDYQNTNDKETTQKIKPLKYFREIVIDRDELDIIEAALGARRYLRNGDLSKNEERFKEPLENLSSH